jgi:prolyl-tRNA editing enzyme YbaK/EbsC (Cys-tRNA(Pro) deacylase)
MSKSLKRVARALAEAGIETEIVEMPDSTRTAVEAAAAVGCEIDQIAKSIVFRAEAHGTAVLFVTAGGNKVDAGKASALAGEPLGKADAGLIRAQTGFVIGGVAPVGHLSADPRLVRPALAGLRHGLGGGGHAPARLCHRAGRSVAPVGGGARRLHGLSGRICRQIRAGKAGFSAASDDRSTDLAARMPGGSPPRPSFSIVAAMASS